VHRIDTLIEQAKEVLSGSSREENSILAKQIFPPRKVWEDKLRPLLNVVPNKAMAITNALRGAINVVPDDPEAISTIYKIPFDSNYFSPALRVVIFVLRLVADTDILSMVDAEQKEATFIFFPMAIQLVDDNLTVAGTNHMWNLYIDDLENEMAKIVSEGRKIMAKWIESSSNPTDPSQTEGGFLAVWERELNHISGTSPYSFHLGRSFARIFAETVDTTGTCTYSNSWKEWTRKIRTTPDVIFGAAFLSAFKALLISTPGGRRFINEIIADMTGFDFEKSQEKAVHTLVLFNILVPEDESVVAEVPKQRLVFLIKHIVESLKNDDAPLPISVQSEALMTLCLVLPFIKDIYGSHWQDILAILGTMVGDPASDASLQRTHACLRMITIYRSLAKDESNDDLQDCWEAWRGDGLQKTLVKLLHSFNEREFHVNQPRNIVTDALARQIDLTKINCNEEDVNDIYGLLRVENRGVQKAASILISRYLPDAQETLSVQVGASGGTARLPDELLSLLLETPSLETLAQRQIEERMWLSIRGYLLGWKALFDHFKTAVRCSTFETTQNANDIQSHKVRTDYVYLIKEGNYLPSLLTFFFDFLGHATGKLVDASKFPITTYTLDSQESSEKDIQSFVIHLYYLCLVHLPTVTKPWWIDSKKRVKGPIETWTQKFVSPHVISSAFKQVSNWEMEGTNESEEHALEIKISPKASELIASITVDEGGDSPPISIAISLPPAYPLQPAAVVGRQRVVVDEKRWRSWLLTIQGVIMFHGNLADGLMAFRKNVQGALKGQSECAICYSVISTEMQTPNKRCGTCKNMFHSSCLYRWFKSSNSSSCPLCRNSFNYG
jgi:hypothetical protein